MARSKRDDLKRKCAQAVNHLAAAVLDVNEVYIPFEENKREEAQHLELIMRAVASSREALIHFVKEAWGLDEEQLMGWM